MKTFKLAVIGTGHLGRIHARLAAELSTAELVGVVDQVVSYFYKDETLRALWSKLIKPIVLQKLFE